MSVASFFSQPIRTEAVLLVGLLGIWHHDARADIFTPYALSTCDASAGIATITLSNVYDSDPPPQGAIPYEKLHSPTSSPVVVCDLGPHRAVSVLGIRNYDHPREDSVWVEIGGRRLTNPLAVGTFGPTRLSIRRLPVDYRVELTECSYEGHCDTRQVTAPSFDCRRAARAVDEMVCGYDALSDADIELNAAYRDALNRAKNNSTLIADEATWLKQREDRCRIPSVYGVDGDPRNSIKDPQVCLERIYRERIGSLKATYLTK